jgi:hypothetical protein
LVEIEHHPQGPREIDRCRLSGSEHLVSVLNLGVQKLTGVFPKERDQRITEGPLELVWCPDSGLLQLKHSYDLEEMYGLNYGYRSGLNQTMVDHFDQKMRYLERVRPLASGDMVVDIGSNDATALKAYTASGIKRIGIDPSAAKFLDFYSGGIELIPDFFSASTFRSEFGDEEAAIVTSIAMFYDLESPLDFVREVSEIMAEDGIWHFEQSYMPSMLKMNAYDTVCHEHLEYYSLAPVMAMLDACDLRIVDVQLNSINGGSFAVTACKRGAPFSSNAPVIEWLIEQEERMGLHTPRPFREFETRVFEHRRDLLRLLAQLAADGKKVLGYGASTKGNVLLQFAGLSEKQIPAIAEVNPDKFGSFTPGTLIPIVSEAEAKAMEPDYFLVLPWHFKRNIVAREEEFLASGGSLIFPLPEIEIVSG